MEKNVLLHKMENNSKFMAKYVHIVISYFFYKLQKET